MTELKKIASDLHRKVKFRFVWTSDKIIHPDYFDHWQPHADKVEQGKTFRDDCDGFSLTCAELLSRNPIIQKKDIKIIFCQTETKEGHLVAALQHWILDNRQRAVWAWEELPYKWISSMALDEPGLWRTITV